MTAPSRAEALARDARLLQAQMAERCDFIDDEELLPLIESALSAARAAAIAEVLALDRWRPLWDHGYMIADSAGQYVSTHAIRALPGGAGEGT